MRPLLSGPFQFIIYYHSTLYSVSVIFIKQVTESKHFLMEVSLSCYQNALISFSLRWSLQMVSAQLTFLRKQLASKSRKRLRLLRILYQREYTLLSL
jgi:hypothetical protein